MSLSQRHEDLLEAATHDALVELRRAGKWLEPGGSADSTVAGLCLGLDATRLAGCRSPDGAIWANPDHVHVVEVGKMQPDKWPGWRVLRVGFDGSVDVLNPCPCGCSADIVTAVRPCVAAVLSEEAPRE